MIATNGSLGAPSREMIDTNVLVYAVDRSRASSIGSHTTFWTTWSPGTS